MSCVNGRACTDEAKKQMLDRILDAWKRAPYMRLGQLLVIATHKPDVFYVEDACLLKEVEDFIRDCT
jgi:hypothetical protein